MLQDLCNDGGGLVQAGFNAVRLCVWGGEGGCWLFDDSGEAISAYTWVDVWFQRHVVGNGPEHPALASCYALVHHLSAGHSQIGVVLKALAILCCIEAFSTATLRLSPHWALRACCRVCCVESMALWHQAGFSGSATCTRQGWLKPDVSHACNLGWYC